MLGPVYAMTSLAFNLANGNPPRQAIIEPAIMFLLLCGLMIWFH
jgi:hypothetical protein